MSKDVMLDLIREIREEVKEIREDLKPLIERSLTHDRDLIWIKGGLSAAMACVIGVVAWLANVTMNMLTK